MVESMMEFIFFTAINILLRVGQLDYSRTSDGLVKGGSVGHAVCCGAGSASGAGDDGRGTPTPSAHRAVTASPTQHPTREIGKVREIVGCVFR